MALIGNYSILNRQTTRAFSGGATARVPGMIRPASANFSRFGNQGTMPQKSGIPHGYNHPVAISFPIKPGVLVSREQSASGTLSPTANLGLQIAASPSASGTVTTAIIQIIVGLAAAMSAQGTLTTANMSILSNMVANLSAGGSLTTADLSIIVGMVANMSASGSLSPNMTTLLGMECDISSVTELSPENLASAVWSALATDFNDPGTMGEKMNDAGSAGNPWAALVADNGDPGTFGERVQKLLTVAKFLGLK